MKQQGPVSDNNTANKKKKFILKLFITGASPNSVRAIVNIKSICERYIAGNYSLEVIDVYQQPLVAQQEQIIALPMLIKFAPLPLKRLIGDMSNTNRVVTGLGLIEQ
jgi:circadian clock protein KaiB